MSLCLAGVSQAEDKTSQTQMGDELLHHVVEGDTLIGLAKKYLDDADLWPLFLQYNEVKNPRRLQPGSQLRVPPIEFPQINVIFAHGDVRRVQENNTANLALDIGDQLQEGDKVMVGSDSYLTLQFADNSIIRVRPDSVLRIQRYRDPGTAKPNTRIMELEQGSLDISVVPNVPTSKSSKAKPNHLEIITPMAVAAVRGTRFDVSASDNTTTSGVTEGVVAIRQHLPNQRAGKQALLKTGTGIRVNEEGKLGQVRPLLAAADLSSLPAAVDHSDYLTLDWPDVLDAENYQIRIAKDAEMNQVMTSKESSHSRIKLSNLPDGEYMIGVRAVDGDDIIGFEAKRTINIQAQPVSPMYLGPVNNQTVGKTVKLECTQVIGATAYRVQISKSQEFESIVVDADELENCSYSDSSLEDGRYYWRVAAIGQSDDGQLKQGPFSKPAQFEVDQSTSPDYPDNPSSAYWMEDRALKFTAQISRDEDFSDIISEQVLEGTQLSLEDLAAGIYFIRLQANDEEGFSTNYSTPRMVDIKLIENTMERTWADKHK
ncbi:MAG: FecR domain-containing protein [Nitrosomonadales bacterium]|nr:FecR domain-containing protein [Nitrosomonadales bacterium]